MLHQLHKLKILNAIQGGPKARWRVPEAHTILPATVVPKPGLSLSVHILGYGPNLKNPLPIGFRQAPTSVCSQEKTDGRNSFLETMLQIGHTLAWSNAVSPAVSTALASVELLLMPPSWPSQWLHQLQSASSCATTAFRAQQPAESSLVGQGMAKRETATRRLPSDHIRRPSARRRGLCR